MKHEEIILTNSFNIYDADTGRESKKIFAESFTFNTYRMNGKNYVALLTFVGFNNFNFYDDVNDGGISLGKSFLVEVFKYDADSKSDNRKIQIAVTNDLGERKFYPLAAFRFQKPEEIKLRF
ncbi:MAG: hypothetical protein U5N85_16345 [Arcicella sp.]|nr:hypothetical protein [Arcicella sp.]